MKKTYRFAAFTLAAIMEFPLIFTACSTMKKESSSLSPPAVEEILPTPPQTEEIPETPPVQEEILSPEPDVPTQSTPTPEPEPEPVKSLQTYIRCTGSSVNLRSGAGTDYAVLGSAEKGTSYAVVGKTGNWYKVYYKNKPAYVSASYVAVFSIEKSDNSVAEDVIGESYKQIGVPYVYGAVRVHDGKGNLLKNFTTSKFDCSSLVQYAFYKGAGVLLQTTTRTQIKQGKYVKPSDLQRGDCLFFTNDERRYNTGIERVGHVAIYLGNNYILHTASDYARIEQISDKRWSYYIEARRFV